MRIKKKINWGRYYFVLLLCGFLFFSGSEAIAAVDNAACLKCHKNPRLSKGKKDGSLLSLYVDESAFQVSVHGAAGLGCTDCHQDARPDVHPVEGIGAINCDNCHQDVAEAYKKTSHGMMLESGMENAPKCTNCHGAHYIRQIKDPASPLATPNISKVCAACHEEAKPVKGFLASLASFRLKGHPKTGLDQRYDTQNCVNCHPENTGHPQKEIVKSTCVRCHDKSYATPLLLGPIHFKNSGESQPLYYGLRIFYGVSLTMGVIAILSIYAYRFFRRRKIRSNKSQD